MGLPRRAAPLPPAAGPSRGGEALLEPLAETRHRPRSGLVRAGGLCLQRNQRDRGPAGHGALGASAPPPALEHPCQMPTLWCPRQGSLGGSPPRRPAVRAPGAEGGGSRLLPAWKFKNSILLSDENKVQTKLLSELH